MIILSLEEGNNFYKDNFYAMMNHMNMKKILSLLSITLLFFALISAKNQHSENLLDKGKFPELKVEVYNNGKKVSFIRKKLLTNPSDTTTGWVRENVSVQDLGKLEVKILNAQEVSQVLRQNYKLVINQLDIMLVRGERLIGNPQTFADYHDAANFSAGEWLRNQKYTTKDRLVVALSYAYQMQENPALSEQKAFVVNFELR